jgi:hypothetical protein
MGARFDLVRDVLDMQLVDRGGTKMGRVDGVVLAIDDGGQPRVDHLELGFVVLARRIHPRLESWLATLRERWSVRRSARQIVPWAAVIDLNQKHIQLDVEAVQTPAFDWERALRRLIRRLPGAEDE